MQGLHQWSDMRETIVLANLWCRVLFETKVRNTEEHVDILEVLSQECFCNHYRLQSSASHATLIDKGIHGLLLSSPEDPVDLIFIVLCQARKPLGIILRHS
jgi:hypothetical protein